MSAHDERVVLAIDGGNIKTDVALVAGDGRLLSLIRGGTSSPHALGFPQSVDLLSSLVAGAHAAATSGRDGREASDGVTGQQAGDTGPAHGRIADIARVLLAGADLPEEVEDLQQALGRLEWAPQLIVENDTLALLRTGTDRGWGVAVVCGGGINAVGIAPDGRAARFPALGAITGDWGGGHDVGVAGLSAASRSADGRGPVTTLEHAVPEHFGLSTPFEVARAVHFREISLEELAQLSPVVYGQADVDQTARKIVERVADEVAAFARAALTRLDLCDAGADVVIGGGLMRAAPPWMLERIEQLVTATSANATLILAHEGPIVGATILGLDAIGAGTEAISRARAELQSAIAELGQQPVA
ncbi:MAG TPA: BadF/BadG/BcrA/BcrD ATPase family protein [Solirubrobacteraceae bacterium]|jgi:N-acetylglucosamine kinase-like BadF-type ATPase|nr:BadF/BadG/BcrA/BcrD ATPase family protein [Solirubrobacteraceae bacterium]